MGVVKDVYDISIDIVKFAISQYKVGLKKREIKNLLKTCLATGTLPKNIDQILDDAEKLMGGDEIHARTLRGMSTSVKESAIKHKVSAKKRPAAKKKPAAKKMAR